MPEASKAQTRIDDTELAHEAALAEDPLRSEAQAILRNYSFAEELLEEAETAFLSDGCQTQTVPEAAAAKLRQAEEIGNMVLEQGSVRKSIRNDVELSRRAAIAEDKLITKAKEDERLAAERREAGDQTGSKILERHAAARRVRANKRGARIIERALNQAQQG